MTFTVPSPASAARALLATALLAGGAARAQDEPAPPTCAERGLARLAVMVPPGRDAEEIRAAARAGSLAPAGTEVFILPPGHFTRVRNAKEHGERMTGMLRGLLALGVQAEGTGTVLMLLDEAGAVAEVRPNTGNARLDRQLDRIWRRAEWEPYTVGGCRVRAWIHVPLAFSSENSYSDSGSERRMEIRPAPPR